MGFLEVCLILMSPQENPSSSPPKEGWKPHLKRLRSGCAGRNSTRHGRATTHCCSRATTHGCASRHNRASPARRLCLASARLHGCAALLYVCVICCFPLLCFPWYLGLPWISNLPWNRSWSLPFYQNPKIFSKSKTKHILGTIWIERR